MLGLIQLQLTIEEVREAYGHQALHLAGLVLTKMSRNNVSRDVETELRSRFGARVYRTTIPLSAKIEEAHTRGQTVLEYAPKSSGAVAYGGLVDEVLSDGRAKNGRRASAVGGAGTVDAA